MPHDSRVRTPLVIPKHLLPEIAKPEPAPEPNEHKPTAPHISFSQLNMYLRCSMQYYFRYIEHLKERPKVSLSLGKGGHAALEWNTLHKLKTGADRTPDEVVQKASDMMDFYLSEMPPSEYEKDAEPGALKDKQLAATRVYQTRDAPSVVPVGAEIEYNLDLNQYLPASMADILTAPIRPVNMKIDLLRQDRRPLIQNHDQGVAVAVEDYKYVTRKKTQAEVNMSPQLTTYDVAVRDITGKWPTQIAFRMMHPGSLSKKPKNDDPIPDSILLEREAQHMTPEARERRMVRIAYQFAQVEEAIRDGRFIPVDDPITCSWCGFRERCQGTSITDFEAAVIRSQTLPPQD